LSNSLLIVTGALVGSSGAILSYIMCRGMNRSIFNVILGGFGTEGGALAPGAGVGDRLVRSGSAEDAAFIMRMPARSSSCRATGWRWRRRSTPCAKMADILKKEGVNVRYAIHPVAGRMPGHMNVLLARPNVPYDEVFRIGGDQPRFRLNRCRLRHRRQRRDQPGRQTDPSSPIYGMRSSTVERAKTVLSSNARWPPATAGVENELFYRKQHDDAVRRRQENVRRNRQGAGVSAS